MQRVTELSYAAMPPVFQQVFLLFALYLIIPVVDLPVLGLSLSAPMLALVAINVVFGQHDSRPRVRMTPWLAFTYVFWVALLLSLAVNNLQTPGFTLSSSSLLTLIRFAYWLASFVITVRVVATESPSFVRRLVLILGLGGVALALMRLSEAVLFGRWGAWTHSQLMTQNDYGFHFSMIAPFVVMLPLLVGRRWRIPAILGIVVLMAAIAGNGSRSSWVAGGIAAIVALGLYALAQPRHLSRVAVALGVGGILFIAAVSMMPWSVLAPVADRFATFQQIDEDKSYQIRVLMTQKSLRLLETNPLFGVGLHRFKDVSVQLEIPTVLNYGNQDYFEQKTSHNSYMALLAETGLVGFTPFVALIAALALRGGYAALRLARHGEFWAIAVYGGFIGMSIHLWTVSGLTDTFTWFTYGLVAAMIERDIVLREPL